MRRPAQTEVASIQEDSMTKSRFALLVGFAATGLLLFWFNFALVGGTEKVLPSTANTDSKNTIALTVPPGMRPVIQTESRLIDYTVMVPVREEHEKQINYTVVVPKYETVSKTVTYTVMNVVREEKTKTVPGTEKPITYTVINHVPERKEKTVEYTTCRMVREPRTKTVNYTTCRMVREKRQKTIEYQTVRFEPASSSQSPDSDVNKSLAPKAM